MNIYRISEVAICDLNDIWLYTLQNWSIEQADRYHQILISEIEYLSENPESGKSIDFMDVDYRSSRVKSHIIIYNKLDNDEIEIIRIIHQMMDIYNKF